MHARRGIIISLKGLCLRSQRCGGVCSTRTEKIRPLRTYRYVLYPVGTVGLLEDIWVSQ